MMPRKATAELHQLEFLPVQFGHHLGTPVFMDLGELFSQGKWIHGDDWG